MIPARAGSKGVPGKNTRLFGGKPLVSWAIECGQRTCTRTVVTSDDPEVLRIAGGYGAEVLERPAKLAQDETPMLAVLEDVLARVGPSPDCLVLLQPTQPLRTDLTVKAAIWALKLNQDVDSVASVCEIPAHMSPDYACSITKGLLTSFLPGEVTRRQDCRTAYYRDGTVYVMRPWLIRAGKMYGRCRPLLVAPDESCTIDVAADWARAEEMRARCSNG